jgi:hypothetical protein
MDFIWNWACVITLRKLTWKPTDPEQLYADKDDCGGDIFDYRSVPGTVNHKGDWKRSLVQANNVGWSELCGFFWVRKGANKQGDWVVFEGKGGVWEADGEGVGEWTKEHDFRLKVLRIDVAVEDVEVEAKREDNKLVDKVGQVIRRVPPDDKFADDVEGRVPVVLVSFV